MSAPSIAEVWWDDHSQEERLAEFIKLNDLTRGVPFQRVAEQDEQIIKLKHALEQRVLNCCGENADTNGGACSLCFAHANILKRMEG